MTMLRSLTCYVLIFAFTQFTVAQTSSETAAPSAASAQLLGYTSQTSGTERDLEKKFQDGIVAANIRESDRRLALSALGGQPVGGGGAHGGRGTAEQAEQRGQKAGQQWHERPLSGAGGRVLSPLDGAGANHESR